MAALKGLPDAVAKLTNAGALDKEIEAQLKLAEMEHARAQAIATAFDEFAKQVNAAPEGKSRSPWRQRPFASSWIRKRT